MSSLPLWRVDELRLRYELEPSLRDLFVEGAFDREVFAQLSARGKTDRIPYEIDVVEISDEMLKNHGLTRGNKQSVIALARELATIEGACEYLCLVDRDLDHWFGKLEETSRLRWTSCTSLECYFLASPIVRTLVVTVSKAKIVDWDRFYTSFLDVLGDMYALRIASRELEWNLKWVAFDKSFSMEEDSLSFDIETYVTKLLNGNSRAKDKVEFQSTWRRWRSTIGQVDGLSVRGHDFVDLMAWSIRKGKGLGNFADAEALERLLILGAPENEQLIDAVS